MQTNDEAMAIEKAEVQCQEKATGALTPSGSETAGTDTSLTWKTWLVIFVRAILRSVECLH